MFNVFQFTVDLCKIWDNLERGARAFDELRRYQSIQMGPKNVHFGETHFKDRNKEPNTDFQIFKGVEVVNSKN